MSDPTDLINPGRRKVLGQTLTSEMGKVEVFDSESRITH